MSIHEQLKAAGCEIHNHESDLYVPVDEISAPIVNAWEFKNQVERFPDATNGRLMYCLPFAYDPYWNRLEDRYAEMNRCVDCDEPYEVAAIGGFCSLLCANRHHS